jgi:gp16 family phage-associated protein
MKKLKTPQEVRIDFRHRGQAIAEWARLNKFSPQIVNSVLAGNRPCHRGMSHKIAVLLCLKDGEIVQ